MTVIAANVARQASLAVHGRMADSGLRPQGYRSRIRCGGFPKVDGHGGRRGAALLQAVLLAEAVDAAAGVHDLLLARVEGVAVRADFDLKVLAERRARLEGVATAAGHRDLGVLGMNTFFHGVSPGPWCVAGGEGYRRCAAHSRSPLLARRD